MGEKRVIENTIVLERGAWVVGKDTGQSRGFFSFLKPAIDHCIASAVDLAADQIIINIERPNA